MEIRTELAESALIAQSLRRERAAIGASGRAVYARYDLPPAYGERSGSILDAVTAAFEGPGEDFYVRGAELGLESARWVRGRGERLSSTVDTLHRARIEFFLVEVPDRLPQALRPLAVRQIASFLTGYIGGLYSGDTATDFEFAGLAVRRLSTARSVTEIERVAVGAVGRLIVADAAWIARRNERKWTLSTQRGLHSAAASFVVSDEQLVGLEALLSGEIVAYDRPERATPELLSVGDVLGVRVALAVPLLIEGACIGLLAAGRTAALAFGPHERALLEILGAQVSARLREVHATTRLGTALDALRESDGRLREQLRRKEQIVEVLQRIYIPRAFPIVPGIGFDAVYVPAEDDARVGGDWYDVFELPDGRLVFSVGDVAGHGVHAAVTMGAIRQAIYVASLDSPDPAAVLRIVNRALLLQKMGMATAILGFLDPHTRVVAYASAGHPPAIVSGREGTRFLEPGGIPLGVFADPLVAESRIDMRDETLLVLYSDGLIEYDRDLTTGQEALRRAIEDAAPGGPGTEAVSIVERVLGGDRTSDDLALLVIRFAPHGEHFAVISMQTRSDSVAWDFDASEPRAGAAVRAQFVAFLRRFVEGSADIGAAELILGELLANVVEHAPGPVHVEVAWRGDEPVLTVRDGGRGFAMHARLPADPWSESGRGLYLVSTLADRLSISTPLEGGTEIAAVLPLRRLGSADDA